MNHAVIFVCVLSFFDGVLSYAQHPGAYSSPHYAKKNIQYSQSYNQPDQHKEPEYQKVSTVDRFDKTDPERSKHHEIDLIDDTYDRLPNKDVGQSVESNDLEAYGGNETQSGRSSGFMATASHFLSGRGGQMLADIARELISRSTGASSQVLSLNLTNLVILVVLKALILAAGMFGAGAFHHGHHGRSLEEENSIWIKDDELSLWLGYLNGGEYECLSKAACNAPALAKKYTSGADILLTGAKLFSGTIAYDKSYEKIVEDVKEAARWGTAGMNCDAKYKCSKQN